MKSCNLSQAQQYSTGLGISPQVNNKGNVVQSKSPAVVSLFPRKAWPFGLKRLQYIIHFQFTFSIYYEMKYNKNKKIMKTLWN
uniref:Uncharacterized protein n=1 Tax=Anguilla anguilla TaxID=7936 RepID=A0A0E9WYG5_ANGAN